MADPTTTEDLGVPADLVETHVAILVFVGDRVFKLKKPVSLGFVDLTSRAARERACLREVELNARLSPDVYDGVLDVCDRGGAVVDHLVAMRRLPADRRLSSLVRAGAPLHGALTELAGVLAAFHDRCGRSPLADATATAEATRARWDANADRMAPAVGVALDAPTAARVRALAGRYLDGRARLFEARIEAGRVRDGHGDLLADDIFCLEDGPRVLDCLEFDERLRVGDVLGDVAFLAMDLEHLGRPDLATSFLEAYRAATDQQWPASLAHHYVAYRAQVRCLVACTRARQGDGGAVAQAQALLALAERHLEAGRVRLVVVGGLPATGKSTVADGLGAELGALVLRSDELRKGLAGLDAATPAPAPFGTGLYDPSTTVATYRELLARAGEALAMGSSVVLDASFVDASHRAAAAALAAAAAADLTELRCTVPRDDALRRLRARHPGAAHGSDADVEVYERLARADLPWPTAATVDTAAPPSAVREAVRRALRARATGSTLTRSSTAP